MEKIKRLPHIRKVICVLLIILGGLVIFSAGMAVGFRKGEFSRRFDEHYMEAMGGPRSPFSVFPEMHSQAPTPHGVVGQIITVNPIQTTASTSGSQNTVLATQIVIRDMRDPRNMEQTVIVGPQTIFRKLHSQASSTDIQIGSWVTAIGTPDENGKIIATFIRIIPSATSTI
jgi:hypothetical protein